MLRGIRAKVVAAIVAVLVVAIAVSVVITVRGQRDNLLDSKRTELVATSSIVNTSVRNIMLPGEAPIAVRLLEEMGETPGFERLEIYRPNGQIAFSDFETLNRVNDRLGGAAFSETPRLDSRTLQNATFDEVVATNTPRQVENLADQRLQYYFPILNYEECRSCHGTSDFVQGVAVFELSLADVFGRINSARNNLIAFYVFIGIVISGLLIQLMQRIVVRPLRQIGHVAHLVGEGNLDVRAESTGSREFERLSIEINGMISGLEEKNRLEVQNRVIEARDEENRKYLDNIGQGLLLVNRDRRISQQYSQYIETLFGTDQVAGRTLSEFVYPGDDDHTDARRELDQFIDMLFDSVSTDMEMIMSINPLAEAELEVPGDDGPRRIVVDADFQRISADDGSVESVMVIFDDRTDVVRAQEELESERRRYKTDIEHIATLLRAGPETYADFERDTAATVEAVEQVLEQTDEAPAPQTREALMRDLHSLKGTARYLEFGRIAELAHGTEEILSEVAGEGRQWDSGTLRDMTDNVSAIRDELENLHQIYERFRSFARTVPQGEAGSAALEDFAEHLEGMARDIAADLDKDVDVRVENRVRELPQLSRLRNPIIHLVRNAIDHGIEDQFERLSNGKNGTARLRVRFEQSDGSYRVIVIDDGRGIDFEAVRRRAVDRGLINADAEYSEAEILRMLFKPSFTTRDAATEISGRGVGLDVVHEEIRALGGRISVGTKLNRGTRFTITIPRERLEGEADNDAGQNEE